tara:strand:- start:45 stop:1379 length:1335 start_codon:yes stop_codon:yes gene_type:complete
MTSTIKVNKIEKSDGSTLTLGGPSTAVTLACGATQTGFGRTGTVDWQTGSIKTSTFTAVNGEGYFVNTSGSAFNMNLPAGSAGAIVSVADYGDNFNTNNLTIVPNGSDKIGGEAANADLKTAGQSVTLVFVDSTEGWVTVNDSTENVKVNQFIEATGGTITCCGNFKIHTFTSSGTFSVSNVGPAGVGNQVSYLVTAGGGSGGFGTTNASGGGGAGGFREGKISSDPYADSPLDAGSGLTVTATSFPVTVGGGGSAPPSSSNNGSNGSNSIFSTITSAGGGGGGRHHEVGLNGGSGGGGGGGNASGEAGGSGNTPPVSPPQGNNGGQGGSPSPDQQAAGGGGATAVGTNASNPAAGPGGAGAASSITGASVTRAGGGGASGSGGTPGTSGSGGSGGGGEGGATPGTNEGTAGTTNTGGGGGGGANCNAGGAGGSGVVIIRYKFQ